MHVVKVLAGGVRYVPVAEVSVIWVVCGLGGGETRRCPFHSIPGGRQPMVVGQRTTYQAPNQFPPGLMRTFATASREITVHRCGRVARAEHTLAAL